MKFTGGLGSKGVLFTIWGCGDETILLIGYATELLWIPEVIRLFGGICCLTLDSTTGFTGAGWVNVWNSFLKFGYELLLGNEVD